MKREFRYRDYTVYHDGNEYVAEVTFPDDTRVFEIGSRSLDNIVKAIDELYDAVETQTIPEWFVTWDRNCADERARLPVKEPEVALSRQTVDSLSRLFRNRKVKEHMIAIYGNHDIENFRMVPSDFESFVKKHYTDKRVLFHTAGTGKSWRLIHVGDLHFT